jgi:GT2 family glycosyltransferase
VQTVLYGHSTTQLWRLLRGLDAAAGRALAAGLVGGVQWALGDSSPAPSMADEDARSMAAMAVSLSDVTYTFFDANLGSSGGQNRLAEGHDSDLLLVLNPDTHPSPNALVELIKAVDRSEVGVADARQIPLEHPRAYDLVTGETSWASGFCMLVRRPLFDRLGGFDSRHFLLHCDDVDFSWRARAAGYRVVVAPYATVFHDKRPTPDNAWPAPDAEVYHAVLGRLMLATRWDRQDIVKETIAHIEAGDSQVQHEALAHFRSRLTSGDVPDVEPDAHQVAEFTDGEYARHRF